MSLEFYIPSTGETIYPQLRESPFSPIHGENEDDDCIYCFAATGEYIFSLEDFPETNGKADYNIVAIYTYASDKRQDSLEIDMDLSRID